MHGPNSISISSGGFLFHILFPNDSIPKMELELLFRKMCLEQCLLTQIDTISRHVS